MGGVGVGCVLYPERRAWAWHSRVSLDLCPQCMCSLLGWTEQGVVIAPQPDPLSSPLRAVPGSGPAQNLDMGPSPTTGPCGEPAHRELFGSLLGKTLWMYTVSFAETSFFKINTKMISFSILKIQVRKFVYKLTSSLPFGSPSFPFHHTASIDTCQSDGSSFMGRNLSVPVCLRGSPGLSVSGPCRYETCLGSFHLGDTG